MKSTTALKTRQTATAEATRAVAALAALAQETRLAIFRLLVEFVPRGLTPSEIAFRLKLAPATLSFHLKELASAGLIADRRDGRFIWYQADFGAINSLIGYLTEHCCQGTGSPECEPVCAPAACGPSSKRARKQDETVPRSPGRA